MHRPIPRWSTAREPAVSTAPRITVAQIAAASLHRAQYVLIFDESSSASGSPQAALRNISACAPTGDLWQSLAERLPVGVVCGRKD